MRMNEWRNNLGYHHVNQHRLLVYGVPGSGKTQLIGTFPDVFIVDTDRGLRTLEKTGLLPPPHRILELTRDDDCFKIIGDIMIRLRDGLEPFDTDPPQTLAIDSVSKLGDFLLHYLLTNPAGTMKRKNPDYEKPEFDHWGAFLNQMTTLFDIAKDIKQNVVATAGVKDVEASDGTKTGAHPFLRGQFKTIIGHCFDDFLYMEVSGGGKNLHYEAHSVTYKANPAKTRGTLPPRIVNPTYEKLYGEDK